MGRRRKEPSLSDVLLHAPWWVSVMLAIGSYIALHGLLPAMLAANPYLLGVAMMSRGLAWIPATLLCFIALLSYIRERRQRQGKSVQLEPSAKAQRGVARRPQAHSRPAPRISPPDTEGHLLKPARDDTAQTAAEPVRSEIHSWSLDAIKRLEWKRFETLCVWYYEAMGFTVKTVPHGADGGIDATLYKAGLDVPIAVVQCKAWNKPVKVEPVRALGGVMHAQKVRRGVFWSLAGFVGQPVEKYAAEAGIQLLDGADIVERILALDQNTQATLLARAFKGDYDTPTCAACGVKMIAREGKGGPFWGCRNYPSCRVRLARGA